VPSVSIDHFALHALQLKLPPPFGFLPGKIHQGLRVQSEKQKNTTGAKSQIPHANSIADPSFELKNLYP